MMDAIPNGKPLSNNHTDESQLVYPTLPGQAPPEERGQGPFELYPYKDLLPIVTPKIGHTDPPLEDFQHVDPGFRALSHPDPLAFLRGATKITHYAPTIGTEVEGVNLVNLTSDGRDQLALEVAKRKVMVFRDQKEFYAAGPEYWKAWGEHFGRLHVSPTGGYPEGFPELHIIYRDHKTIYYDTEHTYTWMWHTDMSFERQPPAFTTFFLLAHPLTGGDTVFYDAEEALRRLSPDFVAFLRTLRYVSHGIDPYIASRGGKRVRPQRRECVTTIHPVIRKHPVTGKESLFLNPGEHFRGIVGFKKEESDAIVNFLNYHITSGVDCQIKVHWTPGSVVVWDNRCTNHSAIFDYQGSIERRHGVRVMAQGERPIPALESLDLEKM